MLKQLLTVGLGFAAAKVINDSFEDFAESSNKKHQRKIDKERERDLMLEREIMTGSRDWIPKK